MSESMYRSSPEQFAENSILSEKLSSPLRQNDSAVIILTGVPYRLVELSEIHVDKEGYVFADRAISGRDA